MSRIRQKKANHGRAGRAAIAVLSVVLAFLLSACTSISGQPEPPGAANGAPFALRPQNEKYFREDEWVRVLTLAVSHADYRDRIWDSIPLNQRSEITQSDFLRYVSFLADCLPGSISSFYRASAEESEVIRGYAAKSEKLLTPKPGDASIWWIKARTSDLRELKFAIPVTLNEAGMPYFSQSWLQRQSALYDYVVLYFDALTTGSEAALSSLLRANTEVRTEAQRAAIERRVKDLLTYYRENVIPGKVGYRCIEMVPGRAVFEEQLLSGDSGSLKLRTVVFTEIDGTYRADEKIPQDLNHADTLLLLDGKALFGQEETGLEITAESAIGQLGIPLSIEITGDAEAASPVFRVTWPGLVVEAHGRCDPSSLTFEGTVRQILASYSRFETSTGLRPGDSIHELYRRYPFARENGYLIQLREGETSKTLAVQVESDYIARITLIYD